MEENKCFICEKSLSGGGDATEVKKTGTNTLREASLKRKDNKMHQLKRLKSVVVHLKCQKSYIKESSIAAAVKAGKSKSSAKRSNDGFSWKSKCLFCANDGSFEFVEAETKKAKDKRIIVRNFMTMTIHENITKVGKNRNDEWGRTVISRIENVDLVAAEGRYHSTCIRDFFRPQATTHEKGRPENENLSLAIDHIYSYILENRKECQFSLNEILATYKGPLPSTRSIVMKLESTYKDEIIISQKRSKEPIISFRDTGHKILTDYWYINKSVDEQEERTRVVLAAASIITEDIRLHVYEKNEYPPSNEFLNDVENDIPKTLRAFLDAIILKNKRSDDSKWT